MIQTSCVKSFWPYDPLDHAISIRGLDHIGRSLTNHAADFMLFLGDFIYFDLPYPLGWTQRHYTSFYRQTYASPSWTPDLTSMMSVIIKIMSSSTTCGEMRQAYIRTQYNLTGVIKAISIRHHPASWAQTRRTILLRTET
jgi:hypothetical protein